MYKTKICCKDRIILSNVQGFLPKFLRLVATACANCDKRVGEGYFLARINTALNKFKDTDSVLRIIPCLSE